MTIIVKAADRFTARERQMMLIMHELRAPRIWVAVITLVVLLLLLWAAYAPIRMVVRAEGRIVPSTRSQVVQHLEGGVILSIDVEEGDVVKRGDLLARVNDVQANAKMSASRIQEQALAAKVARLTAESMGTDFQTELKKGAATSAATQAEQDAFLARRLRQEQSSRVIAEQITQKRAELAELKSRRENLVNEHDLARRQLQISNDMLQRQATSRLDHLEAQARVQRLRTMLSDVEASIPRLLASVAEAESRGREAESRFRAEARTELASTRTELQRVQEELKASSDRLIRTELRAPVSGVINRVNVSTLGGVIQPGEAVVEITPTDARVVVEARVRPADRAELHPGLPVRVRLSAYDYVSFGLAEGRLLEISADTVPDDGGGRFYRVKIALDRENGAVHDRLVVPGMSATADIVTGRRTFLSYALSSVAHFSRVAFSEPR